MIPSIRLLAFGLLNAAVAALVGCGATTHDQGKAHAKSGGDDNPAIALKILDKAGLQSLIASHKGKVVVVDAWATYCEPCLKELPGLVELHKKYPGQVACITLSLDYQGAGAPEDKRDEVLEVLRKIGATFDNVLTKEDSAVYYGDPISAASIPAVLVYDRAGKLAKTFTNDSAKNESEHFTYQHVETLVRQLLGSG